MVIVGDVLVTKIMEKVIDVGFSYLTDQWHSGGMKDELQRLKDALPRIQAVVAAADNAWTLEQQTANPGLQEWLQQFKDALYEADDALDELEYLRLQKQVEADDDRDGDQNKKQGEGDTSLDERPHKVRRLLSHAKENIMRFFKPDSTFENLRIAVKRLDGAAAHVGDFLTLVSSVQKFQYLQHQSRTMTSRETGPLVTESIVFGRDREREELLQWLMKGQPDQDGKNNVSLYSVVGIGGMGKTTLAQLVYNDENVQKSFDLKMWVCVSTSFDVIRITAAMLESATKKRTEVDNLATLQDALKDKLMSSNKFLLVLDDVWNDENWSDWDKLLAPLRHGHKGSKILLTTRMDKVAKEAVRAMGGSTKESMQLNPIRDDDFFSLFDRYAFAGITSSDYKELQPIGMQIVKRLGGSPLAAKTIGALLNSNLDERYWTGIFHCKNISDQGQQREGNIMSILMLSYHHLPFYLRPCFAFCGTFPQDHEFDKEDLVLKWMSLGLIQHSPLNQRQALEDIGSYYFGELFNRSFFEQKKGFRTCTYIMHDLLHDVARSVSHGECFSIVNDDKSVEDIPNTVRHLYLATNNLNIVMKVDKWQHLRSLQLRINSHVPAEVDEVLEKVIKSLKCVRMLEVCVDGTRVLPDVFGHLRHLRSLTIRKEIDEFPASLCKLHNLQVLKLTIKDSTAALPENMTNLICLRHLVTSSRYGDRICPVIARVRKIVSLQVLSISIKKEREYKIDELEGLNMIRELHLDGLENVESPEEARMAKLGNKEHLRVLSLKWRCLEWSWDNDTERKMDEQQQIVDCLQPHSSLKELTIVGYNGVGPAKWMDFKLNMIRKLHLQGLENLESPEEGSMAKLGNKEQLRVLSLEWRRDNDTERNNRTKMDEQQQIVDCLQPHSSLKELTIEGYNGVRPAKWMDFELVDNLQRISLSYCSRLEHLPSFVKLPFLKYLSLWNMPLVKQLHCECQQLEELYLNNMEGLEELSQSDVNSGQWCPCLLQLQIGKCPKLSVLPSLSLSLKSMVLSEVGLTALPKMWLDSKGSSSSLLILEIHVCSELTSLDKGLLLQQRYLTALGTLEICNCDMLVDFPAGGLQHLRALRTLKIEHCPNLRLYPTVIDPTGNDENFLPSSLQHLYLKGMSMKSLPSGSVWRTLASLYSLGIDDPMLLLTESFRNLTSIRELHIENCRGIESISGEMEEWLLQSRTTLNKLYLDHAYSLKSLPDSLQTFSSLKVLALYDAGELQSVSRLPSSLEFLNILGCNQTLKDRCRKDEGADWPNINHIRHISIFEVKNSENWII